MKKFFNNLILFISIIIGIYLLIAAHTYYMIKKEPVIIQSKNIIIGDSNTRNAINTKIYSDFENFSQGGESYLFAYTKLKLLLEENKIDTLILAHAPHNIINNKWVKGTIDGNLKYRTTTYFPYYTKNAHLELFKGNPTSYIKSWNRLWKTWLTLVLKNKSNNDNSFLGGYMRNTKIENEKNFKTLKYKDSKITSIEIRYLNKIIALCDKNNIKLIFIATPKNYTRTDFKNYDKHEFYDYYKKHYEYIDFLNFQRLPMPKNSYADISHLSGIGSDYFSAFLDEHSLNVLLKDPKFNERLKN